MNQRSDNPESVAYEICLRLGDDRLILGQLLSEWCGHAPSLEEDIALSNIALDCIGQAALFLSRAGELEGKGRNEDRLAYFRTVREFRCSLLVQQPNGDFAATIMRQYLYDSFSEPLYKWLKQSSSSNELRDIASSAHKEASYHLRHSTEWMKRLGLGTKESKSRLQQASLELLPYFDELFEEDIVAKNAIDLKILPSLSQLYHEVKPAVFNFMTEISLILPENIETRRGGREGMHSEYLGKVLSEMQSLAREFPGATW